MLVRSNKDRKWFLQCPFKAGETEYLLSNLPYTETISLIYINIIKYYWHAIKMCITKLGISDVICFWGMLMLISVALKHILTEIKCRKRDLRIQGISKQLDFKKETPKQFSATLHGLKKIKMKWNRIYLKQFVRYLFKVLEKCYYILLVMCKFLSL